VAVFVEVAVVVEGVASLAEDRRVVVDSLVGEVLDMAVATEAVEVVARRVVMEAVVEDMAVVKRVVMVLLHVVEVGVVRVEDTAPLQLLVMGVNLRLDMAHRLQMMDMVKHPLQVDTVPLEVMDNNQQLQLRRTTVTDRQLADMELPQQLQQPRQVTALLAVRLATEEVQLPLVLLVMVLLVVMVSPAIRQLLRQELGEVMDNRRVLPPGVTDNNQLRAVNRVMDNQRLQVPVTVPNRVAMEDINSCIAFKLPQKQ